MSSNGESSAASAGDYSERLGLETSILQTLCLTVNATGSEIKYKIIDTLSEDDFYFPANKSIFVALIEMHRRGDYVVYTNLEEELRHQSIDIPEDLYIEDLFQGTIPELSDVGKWVTRLKEWSRTALNTPGPTPKVALAKIVKASTSSSDVDVTRISMEPEAPKPVPKSKKASEAVRKEPDAPAPKVTKAPKPVLSSEGEDWGDYLDDLASQQVKSFETGFKGFDEDAGGISTGVLLLVDQEPVRRSGFLKQLTDQIAAKTKVPCLFVSFDATKAALRVRTLSRLSGVPAKDIEKGRLKKDSTEWESVERNGRKAAAWLKRVFVVEAGDAIGLDSIRDMCRQLTNGSEDANGLIVIDNLDKLNQGNTGRSLIPDLKALSDSQDVLVVAATMNRKLLADDDADYAAQMAGGDTGVRLEITPAGESETTTVRFKYQSTIHRFTEQ
jgi:replicative DNA helicase